MKWLSAAWIPMAGITLLACDSLVSQDYTLVDTGQSVCYNAVAQATCPQPGEPFYGQDAQYSGIQPSYLDNGDGTVTDLNTGLMWQKTPDFVNLRAWGEAQTYANDLQLAGYNDWRTPTIKELYSLVQFYGSSFNRVPYIDTGYFDFEYPDPASGLRDMDAQYWSSTVYVGTTMQGDPTAFGVNFADGRIKGYPKDIPGPGGTFSRYIRCVRGGSGYGVNNFVDNGDDTVTDLATGLTWTKSDSSTTMNWQQALSYAENLVLAGCDDWRLPDAKELQSIVDYTRAPDAQDPQQQGPAIDPIFNVTEIESWCWTGTTHLDGPNPDVAVYICFGQAFGYMGPPGSGQWLNVHGAGAQRSDPKEGDPADWPYGRGPQGDEVRIFNYVRCVRGSAALDGDLNCDSLIDQADILAFVKALIDPSAYALNFPDCNRLSADVTDDGSVDGLDVQPFTELLTTN